jgi:hypothetical protein
MRPVSFLFSVRTVNVGHLSRWQAEVTVCLFVETTRGDSGSIRSCETNLAAVLLNYSVIS